MDNPGGVSRPILPDKAVFVQCRFLSEDETRVGCAVMTTVPTPWERKEPFYIMIPIDTSYARRIEGALLIINGETVEVNLDALPKPFVSDAQPPSL